MSPDLQRFKRSCGCLVDQQMFFSVSVSSAWLTKLLPGTWEMWWTPTLSVAFPMGKASYVLRECVINAYHACAPGWRKVGAVKILPLRAVFLGKAVKAPMMA